MSFLDKANEQGGQVREPLTAGTYKDLRIIKYHEDVLDKNGAHQYKYGVVSKSREGFARLRLVIQDEWLDDATVAIALGSDAEAVAAGELKAKDIDRARDAIKAKVDAAIEAANTPEEKVGEATEKQLANALTNIRIKVGTMLRLQKWAGLAPSLVFEPESLVGVEFSGKVKGEEYQGKMQFEVDAVYSVPKGFVAPAKAESFDTVAK